ncbi:5985_t:CDS:1, partial [Rhizophagus irregularis]
MEYTNLQPPADLENQPSEPVLQYSYNKYNKNTKTPNNHKNPQNHKNNNQYLHTPDNNDIPTMSSRNYIREPRNDEDENMLNHIEHHLFDDQDTRGSTSSTSQTHDAPISTSSQLRTQFIDYYKF